MLKQRHYDSLVIGGGFFGSVLAAELRQAGRTVALCEKQADLLQRASYANQARVHHGYHYPRSVLTALRSRVNFPRFVRDYEPAIVSDFTKLYAVPRMFSKVTARQYRLFMERVGAPITPAGASWKKLFNPKLIEEVFACVEYAFDAVKLKELCVQRLNATGVEVCTGTEVLTVATDPAGLRAGLAGPNGRQEVTAREVFNCTYSQINALLERSGLERLNFKHELAEMALVEPPEELLAAGVTVMCGPFFSCMPFPARGLHTLSHVRYTPHLSWLDRPNEPYINPHEWMAQAEKHTHFEHMMRDAARYLPAMAQCAYRDSLWEIKTVLPQSEVDDSRPILYRRDQGLRGLTCIMGGKIDNIYDVLAELLQRPVAAT